MEENITKSENEIIKKIKRLDKTDRSLKGYGICVFLWHLENALNSLNDNNVTFYFNAKNVKNYFSFLDSDRETLLNNNVLSVISDLNNVYYKLMEGNNLFDTNKLHHFLYELSGASLSERFSLYRKNFACDVAYLEDIILLWSDKKDLTIFKKTEIKMMEHGFYIASVDFENKKDLIDHSFISNQKKINEALARDIYLDIAKYTVRVIDNSLDNNPDLRFGIYYNEGKAQIRKISDKEDPPAPSEIQYCINLFNHVQRIYSFKDLSGIMMWFKDKEDVSLVKRDKTFFSTLYSFAYTLRTEDEFNINDFLTKKNIEKEKQGIENTLNSMVALPKKDEPRL